MGLFSKNRKVDPNDIEELRTGYVDAQTRLERAEADRDAAAGRLNSLEQQIAQLADRASATDVAGRGMAEHLSSLDQRVTGVSTELANQLSELGNDIERLSSRPADAPSSNGQSTPVVSDETVEALRAGQTRLAAEQARYEIAFRQDLATLAEQIRKAGGR